MWTCLTARWTGKGLWREVGRGRDHSEVNDKVNGLTEPVAPERL